MNCCDDFYDSKTLKKRLKKYKEKFKASKIGMDPINNNNYTSFPLYKCNGIRFNEFNDINF